MNASTYIRMYVFANADEMETHLHIFEYSDRYFSFFFFSFALVVYRDDASAASTLRPCSLQVREPMYNAYIRCQIHALHDVYLFVNRLGGITK